MSSKSSGNDLGIGSDKCTFSSVEKYVYKDFLQSEHYFPVQYIMSLPVQYIMSHPVQSIQKMSMPMNCITKYVVRFFGFLYGY